MFSDIMEDQYIQRSPFQYKHPKAADVYSLLKQSFSRYASNDALIHPSNQTRYTFAELEDEVEQVAAGMKHHGVGAGDSVAFYAQNSLEYIIMTLATWRLGAAFCGVNYTQPIDEVQQLLALEKPKYVFTDAARVSAFLQVINSIPSVKIVFLPETHSGCVSFATLKNTKPRVNLEPHSNVTKEDVACVLLTSGTTGLPKAVMLSHENMVFAISSVTEPEICTVKEQERQVVFIPLSHTTGLLTIMVGLLSGCASILMEQFDLDKLLEIVSTFKVDSFVLVPSIAILLTKHPVATKYDLSHVREIICGAAPLGEDTIEQLRYRLRSPVHFRQGYGLSETSGVCTLSPGYSSSVRLHPHSVGFPVPGVEVKVVDINTRISLGPDEQGEIVCRGGHLMKGYRENSSATAEVIDRDGWLHTGDAGYYKEDGSFYIVDRIKSLIKYKNYQIPPAELEDLLLSHPLVKDCAVISVPDEESGEVPLALVVRKNESLKEDSVIDFVAEKVAPHKRLRGGVRFTDVIPKSPSGKILRFRIQQSLEIDRGIENV